MVEARMLLLVAWIVASFVLVLAPPSPAHARVDTTGLPVTLASPSSAAASTVVYLPNVTKTLGGPDGWQTPFIVQNVGSTSTDVAMSFYAFADGSLVKTRSIGGLAAGASVFHDPNSDAELPDGGQFSVVVTSTSSAVVAVVNEHQNVRNTSRQEALSYSGLSSGSTVVSLPYVAKRVNGWLTTIVAQNLGSAATSVTAKFSALVGGATVTLTRAIGPGRSQFIDPSAEPLLTAGMEYAATLSADQPIAAVVNAHNDAPTATYPMGLSYNGVPASSVTDVFIPYLAKNADTVRRSTRLYVQNAGLSAATPALFIRALGSTTAKQIDLLSVQPGAAISFDAAAATQLSDGEYSVHVMGGQFAVVSANVTATSATGYAGTSDRAQRLYLPNVTRTLGGANGWTTPIVLQSMTVYEPPITVRWYRFRDGLLAYTQTVTGLAFGSARRIDPRGLAALADDTQYAVVIDAPLGAAAVVTEINPSGGDGEMTYEAFPPPATGDRSTSSCSPSSGAAGTTFTCRFVGLPPGTSATATLSTTTSAGTTQSVSTVATDGTLTLFSTLTSEGLRTITVTAAAVTKFAQVTVTPGTFTVEMTGSANGAMSVHTLPALNCYATVTLSSGSLSSASGLGLKTTDGSGNASWTYAAVSAPTGTTTNTVRCASGDLIRSAAGTFTVAAGSAGSVLVSVTWNGEPVTGMPTRLKAGSATVTSGTTDAAGQVRFAGVAAGTYTVSLDLVTAAGGPWACYSAVPGFSVTVQAGRESSIVMEMQKPFAALEPADGATLTSPVTLRWDAFPQATSYRVYVRNEATSTYAANQTTTATQSNVAGLTPGTKYRWWVIAVNSTHEIGCTISRTLTTT